METKHPWEGNGMREGIEIEEQFYDKGVKISIYVWSRDCFSFLGSLGTLWY